MSGPLGRLLAQVVIGTVGIVSRAFLTAYSQAVRNARAGTQQSVKAMTAKSKMSQQEALQILNLRADEMRPAIILKRYNQYFELNDPDKGGSFYLQSKIFRAKEALDEQLELLAKQAEDDSILRAKGGIPRPGTRRTTSQWRR